MQLKNINKAFTVIELLVVIAVIIIMVLWATNMNFNSTTNKQKLEIFTNKVISQIETVRTNDLVGKAELDWSELEIPDRWFIEVSTAWLWKLTTKIERNSNIENFSELFMEEWFSIDEVWCDLPNWTSYNTTNTWTIVFEKWNYSLRWINCETWETTLSIKTGFRWVQNTISFDTLNWLIKKD